MSFKGDMSVSLSSLDEAMRLAAEIRFNASHEIAPTVRGDGQVDQYHRALLTILDATKEGHAHELEVRQADFDHLKSTLLGRLHSEAKTLNTLIDACDEVGNMPGSYKARGAQAFLRELADRLHIEWDSQKGV